MGKQNKKMMLAISKTSMEFNSALTGCHSINVTVLERAHASPDACEQVADYTMLLAY